MDDILNPVFYPFSLAWNSIWRLCWSGRDGIDYPCAKFKSALFGLPSTALSNKRKTEVLQSKLPQPLPLTNEPAPTGFAVIIGINLFSSSLPQATSV